MIALTYQMSPTWKTVGVFDGLNMPRKPVPGEENPII